MLIVKTPLVNGMVGKSPMVAQEYPCSKFKVLTVDGNVCVCEITCTEDIEAKIKLDNRFEIFENQYPSVIEMGWNFVKAVGRHASNGFQSVSKEEYENRLRICDVCPLRNASKCMKCNCHLPTKAKWKSEHCPMHKWNTPIEITLPKEEEKNDK